MGSNGYSTKILFSLQGAGDAFVGALAFYLACHPKMPLKSAIKNASAIATVSVCKSGTQTSYAYAEELPPEIPH